MNFLNVHVPEELEAAVGYKGHARHFAMYWTPAGDEAMIDHGEVSFDGNWHGYLAFIQHPYIRPHLFGSQLGNYDEEAVQMLIIDRYERRLAIAGWQEGHKFLAHQHSPRTLTRLAFEDSEALREAIRRALVELPMPTPEEIKQMMHEQHEAVAALIVALDQLATDDKSMVN